jgi:hypothetical protein
MVEFTTQTIEFSREIYTALALDRQIIKPMPYRLYQLLPKFKLAQVKLPKLILTVILVGCLSMMGCNASLTAAPDRTKPTPTTASSPPPRSLAQAVLDNSGLAQRYNLYLKNSVDISLASPNTKRERFMAWLHQIIVQAAGWSTVQEPYLKALTAKFSPAELSELVAIAKQPVVQKLIQAESQIYNETADRRRKLLFQVWDDYNNGKFTPPPDVINELSYPIEGPPTGRGMPKPQTPP